MKLSFDLTLEKSRADVWKSFDNPDNLKKWQPTLVSFEPVSGTPGQPGAVSRLTYEEGGRTIILTETITERRHPDLFAGTYESSMGTNIIRNSFTEISPGRTRWMVESEFTCHGFLKLLAPFMKGMLARRVKADVGRFKTKLEAGELSVDHA